MSKQGGVFSKWTRLVITAVIATPIALTAWGAGGIAHAAVVTAVDDAGADDEPGQKDLSALTVDYGAPGATAIDVTWSWDDTATSGANTRDGCSLFDTDGDGLANYALCLTVNNDTTGWTPSLYECTGDAAADRCSQPAQVSTITSTLSAAIDGPDPFGSDGSNPTASHAQNNACKDNPACNTLDTVATALVQLADVGGGVAKLINVCSYPSQEPNSDPSDCVFREQSGFLTIVKTVDEATTDTFTFDASAASANGHNQWTIVGADSVPLISYDPTTTLDLNEAGLAAWNLASASCVIQAATPTPTGTPTATGVNDLEIRSGLETICTFDNHKKQAGLTVVKQWQNAKVGDAVSITTTGATNNVNFAASASQATETDTTPAPYKVFPGETLTFAESFNPGTQAAYTTTLGCTGASDANPNDGLTIAPTDTAITCTYTNARRPVQVVVAKQLAPAGDPGLFDLSINGATKVSAGSNGANSSASPVTVYVGDSVSIAEVAAATSPLTLANYSSTWSCNNGITLSPNSGTSGSFTVPTTMASNTTITCTFSNTRKSATFTLNKDWGSATTGDVISLSGSATLPAPIGAPIAAQSTAPTDTNGSSMTVYAGQTISFSEAFAVPAKGDNYLSSLSCKDGQNNTFTSGITIEPGSRSGSWVVGSSPTSITCTIGNTLKTGGVIVQKVWVNGRPGDTATLRASIGAGTPVEDTSTAPDAPSYVVDEAVNNVVSIPAFSGNTVNFGETLDAASANLYTTAWACDGAVDTAGTTTSGSVTVTPADAGVNPIVCTITNTRKSATLTVQKTWTDPVGGPTVTLGASGGLSSGLTGTTTSTSPTNRVAPNAPTMTIYAGETINVSEAFADAGTAAMFTSSLTCTPTAATGVGTVGATVSGSIAVASSPVNTTCTFNNTRKSATLVLQKTWVNGHAGDTALLGIDGINDAPATSTATSALGSVTDTTHVASVTAYAGETVTLNETVTPPDNYTSSLLCGAHAITYTEAARTGTIAIGSADAASTVTCTYTNTRKSATLTVEKTWADPVGGPTVTLGASGGLSSGLTGTTTSTSPANRVAPNAPTMTIFAGETINVSEAFNNATTAGFFTSSLTCTPTAATGVGTVAATVSGSIAVGSNPASTTCTFSNTRKSTTLNLHKVWTNGAANDNVSLSITPPAMSTATATAVVPAGGNGQSTAFATRTVYAGQNVTLAEAFGQSNFGSYTITAFSCDDGTADAWVPGNDNIRMLSLADGDDVADAITCTVTNVRRSATLTVEKTWTDPVGGPTVTLAASGGISSGLTGTATSTSPTNRVAPNAPTMTIYSGETINVSEAFANPTTAGYFDTTLSCATPSTVDNKVSGSIVIPAIPTDTTCTFHNTRKSTTLTLDKAWVNPVTGDKVTLKIDGTNDSTPGPVTAPATTPTASTTVYAGETVTLSETIDDLNTAIYDVTGFSCTTSTPLSWSTVKTDLDATLAVAAADTAAPISCTITNTAERGTIVIVKNTDGGNGTFGFNGTWAGSGAFPLTTVNGTTFRTFNDVLVPKHGGYTIAETNPTPAFDGTNVTCAETNGDNGSGPVASSVNPLTGSIDLDNGETVTCTFTNTARSTIVIVKNAAPDAAQDFSFTTTGTGLQNFNLDDDGLGGSALSNTYTSPLVSANATYTVTEGPTFGWTLSQLSCSSGGTGSVPLAKATITPLPGTTVTCTFTNTANPAGLTATKHVDNQVEPWGPFTFELSGGAFTGDSPQDVDSDAPVASWTNLVEGVTYTLEEQGPVPGYAVGTFTCKIDINGDVSDLDDANLDDSGFQFVAVAGANYECDITNTAISPTLVVAKTTVGGVGSFMFDVVANPADGVNAASPALLTANTLVEQVPANSNTSTLMAGEGYTVSEQANSLWIPGSLTCLVTHAAGGPAVAYAFNTPTLPGDAISCSITNTKKASITVIKQTTPDKSPQTFGFEASWNGASDDAPDFELADGETLTMSELVPNTAYSIEELATDGWALTDVQCSGESTSNPAVVTPGPGENITCTFFNSQLGDVLIDKVADPASIERDGDSYTVSYTLTVSNASFVDQSYNLSDTPSFASGVSILSMVVNGPGVTDLHLGSGGGAIVTGGTIAARTGVDTDPLVFTVEVTFTMAGNTGNRACDGPGTGTFNSATVEFAGISHSDDDCVPLPNPAITMTKEASPVTATHVSGNRYQVSYTITATNNGEGAGSYTLSDTPDFGAGIAIVPPLTAESDDAVVNLDFWTGDPIDHRVAIDQDLQAGETDTFTVTAVVDVAFDSGADARECDQLEGAGHGAFNTASLTSNGPTTPDASACVDLPLPDISVEKEAVSTKPEFLGGTSYSVEYKVTVTNDGDGPGQYTMSDLPDFGSGALIDNVTINDIELDPPVFGDIPINPHHSDVFFVLVTFTVDPAMPADDRICDAEDTAGHGAYNGVEVTFNDDGSDHSSDCVDIGLPDITVTKVAKTNFATHVEGNIYQAAYTVTVENTGDGPGVYTANDLPTFGELATIISTVPQVVGPVAINAGGVDVYTVTVTFTVDGSMTTDERDCGELQAPGQGGYNAVSVTFNDGGSVDDHDCVNIPEPDVSRSKVTDPAHPLTRNADGTWTVGYILTVSNAAGAGPASYNLDDELTVGPGVDVTHVAVSEDIAWVTTDPAFNGEDHTRIVTGGLINDGETHVYHVLVDLTIAVVQGVNGDCADDGGINNALVLTVRGAEGDLVNVCDNFSTLTLVKQLDNSSGGNADIDEFELSASAGVPPVNVITGTSPVASAVPAGTYGLSEVQLPGYQSEGFVCDNDESEEPGTTAVVGVGENVICTILNEAQPVDLELTKSDDGFVAQAGGAAFPYTITVQNVGTRDADLGEPVVVTDALPPEFVWESETLPSNCSQDLDDAQLLICQIDPALMTAGGEPVVIVASVKALAGTLAGTYTNKAWVNTQDDSVCPALVDEVVDSCNPPCPGVDEVSSNNVDCEDTPVDNTASITLDKHDDIGVGGFAEPGVTFHYLVSVHNNGPQPVDNVKVHDVLPAELTPGTAIGTGWTCTIVAQTVDCTLPGPLASGATSEAITITVTVKTSFTGDNVHNVASGSADVVKPEGPEFTPQTVTAEDDEDTPVRSLQVSLFSADCVRDAPFVRYNLTPVGFTPTGGATITLRRIDTNEIIRTFTVADLAGLFLYPGASVDGGGRGIDWPGWKFEDGQWVLDDSDGFLRDGLKVEISVDSIAATATANYPAANAACANPLATLADMAIVKTASVEQVGAGGGFQWILNVTNNGPDPAFGVVVGDVVPAAVTVTGVSSSQFTCTNTGNTVKCVKALMAVGETGTVTIDVTVPTTAAGGSVQNIGTVESQLPDPDLSNNSDDASVIIVAQAPPTTTLPPVILPPTGSNSTQPLTTAALGLFLMGGFIVLATRRRRGDSTPVS